MAQVSGSMGGVPPAAAVGEEGRRPVPQLELQGSQRPERDRVGAEAPAWRHGGRPGELPQQRPQAAARFCKQIPRPSPVSTLSWRQAVLDPQSHFCCVAGWTLAGTSQADVRLLALSKGSFSDLLLECGVLPWGHTWPPNGVLALSLLPLKPAMLLSWQVQVLHCNGEQPGTRLRD